MILHTFLSEDQILGKYGKILSKEVLDGPCMVRYMSFSEDLVGILVGSSVRSHYLGILQVPKALGSFLYQDLKGSRPGAGPFLTSQHPLTRISTRTG